MKKEVGDCNADWNLYPELLSGATKNNVIYLRTKWQA
jgi:hypothetical protein